VRNSSRYLSTSLLASGSRLSFSRRAHRRPTISCWTEHDPDCEREIRLQRRMGAIHTLRFDELRVELVGEQRLGQVPQKLLEQARHSMHVRSRVHPLPATCDHVPAPTREPR
jgi:hypothetical protein